MIGGNKICRHAGLRLRIACGFTALAGRPEVPPGAEAQPVLVTVWWSS